MGLGMVSNSCRFRLEIEKSGGRVAGRFGGKAAERSVPGADGVSDEVGRVETRPFGGELGSAPNFCERCGFAGEFVMRKVSKCSR